MFAILLRHALTRLISQWMIAWLLLLVCSNTFAAKGDAYSDHGEWSFSLLIGGHSPDLSALYGGLYKAPLVGQGVLGGIDDINNGENAIPPADFSLDNSLPSTSNGGKASFELRWHANRKHTLVFGIGSWEKTSIGYMSGQLPTRKEMNEIIFERRAKISYTEYSIGWQYSLLRRSKFQLYLRSSIHEIFDIDYREDFVFNYISGSSLAGFSRIQILEAQTAALFMGQIGIGAEVFLSQWFSLGVEGGYFVGSRSASLKDIQTKSDFIGRDSVTFKNPYGDIGDGTVGYLSQGSTNDSATYNKMSLDFSGWQAMLRMNIYY